MEAGECIYYSHVSHTVTGSDGNEITVLTRNEWISTAEMQSEKSEYTSSILLDDNGNAVRQPYAVGDEDLWVEAAYNADNTLKTWIWAGKEYENQEIAARWENGNMVYFNEEDITYAPEYAAPETGFDFGFFLILENWITPASSYMGTPSTNLPAGTTGDSPRTFRYEFDGTGRVTSAYVEEWELHYEIFYGEQEMQEYPKPVL